MIFIGPGTSGVALVVTFNKRNFPLRLDYFGFFKCTLFLLPHPFSKQKHTAQFYMPPVALKEVF